MKKAFAFLLLLAVILTLSIPVFAEDYTYTVRFYSGNQGSFGGQTVVIYDNLKYGDRVSFNMSSVTLKNSSKYYVKGIRESGLDNETVNLTSFEVTEDKDYVVAYGILGDSVAYTVNYVDASGNVLHAPDTYYGNVGDRPVVSYRYIENYQPRYYNITGTLKSNAAENNWTFEYIPLTTPATPTPTPIPTATPTPAATLAPAPAQPAEAGTETGTGTGTETPAAPENPAENPNQPGTNPPAGTETEPGEQPETPATVSQAPTQPEQGGNTETPTEPEEILDIDAPLAEYGDSNVEGSSASSVDSSIETPGGGEAGSKVVTAAVVGGCVAAVAVIAVIIGIVVSKKKKR